MEVDRMVHLGLGTFQQAVRLFVTERETPAQRVQHLCALCVAEVGV